MFAIDVYPPFPPLSPTRTCSRVTHKVQTPTATPSQAYEERTEALRAANTEILDLRAQIVDGAAGRLPTSTSPLPSSERPSLNGRSARRNKRFGSSRSLSSTLLGAVLSVSPRAGRSKKGVVKGEGYSGEFL